MESLYKEALKLGILPQDFWEMSAGEAEQLIKQRRESEQERVEMQASFVWRIGNLCRIGFNDPKKFPKIEEEFPSLFKKDACRQTDWRVMKSRFVSYVQAKRRVKNDS